MISSSINLFPQMFISCSYDKQALCRGIIRCHRLFLHKKRQNSTNSLILPYITSSFNNVITIANKTDQTPKPGNIILKKLITNAIRLSVGTTAKLSNKKPSIQQNRSISFGTKRAI